MPLLPHSLLTAAESRQADRDAIAGGARPLELMQRAGSAVAEVVAVGFAPGRVLVLCGPGNNGGDGFVIARLLRGEGWPVTVCTSFDIAKAKGDAKTMLSLWQQAGGEIAPFSPELLEDCELIVDALYGTGLSRPPEGQARSMIESANASGLPIVSVDIASGVNADTGEIAGPAIVACHTVAFVRGKPGHLLMPGKLHSGLLHIADIGIEGENIETAFAHNLPSLWSGRFPRPSFADHKYMRGHALVLGGGIATGGAARLAAYAALRSGAGLVSVACSREALPVYASCLTAVMTKLADDDRALKELLADQRITATLAGPGYGTDERTRRHVKLLVARKHPCVLDADALTAFTDSPPELFAAIAHPCVLTPHEGEFARLFDLSGSKPQRALQAARQSGAVVVLKGSDTVIAAPDGRCAINASAPPTLATAGAGDVLAGIICGLLAQGMPAYEAACAATYLHGRAALAFGPGLIAEDLIDMLPEAWREIQ